MLELLTLLKEEYNPDFPAIPGCMAHDFAYMEGRKQGWRDCLLYISNLLDPTKSENHVHEPENRGSADEYARSYTPSA
jgi:hypothetical protein